MPTPKEARRALLPPPPPTIAGRRLQPVTAAAFLLLEELGCPLLRLEGDITATLTATNLISTAYILTHETHHIAEAYHTGRLRAEIQAYAHTIPARELPTLAETLAAHISAEFSAFVPYAPPPGTEGKAGREAPAGSPLSWISSPANTIKRWIRRFTSPSPASSSPTAASANATASPPPPPPTPAANSSPK